MSFKTWCVAASACLLMSAPHSAWAEAPETPPSAAEKTSEPEAEPGQMSVEALYEAGKAALGAKKPAEALKHFKAALSRSDGRSAKTWQMLLAVAVAYKDLGYPVHTLEYFKRFLTVTAPHQDIASEKWKRRRATVDDNPTEIAARDEAKDREARAQRARAPPR